MSDRTPPLQQLWDLPLDENGKPACTPSDLAEWQAQAVKLQDAYSADREAKYLQRTGGYNPKPNKGRPK